MKLYKYTINITTLYYIILYFPLNYISIYLAIHVCTFRNKINSKCLYLFGPFKTISVCKQSFTKHFSKLRRFLCFKL